MVEALPLHRWKAGKEVALLPSSFVQVSGWQGIRGPLNLLLCISSGTLVTEWKQEKLIWSCWEAELPWGHHCRKKALRDFKGAAAVPGKVLVGFVPPSPSPVLTLPFFQLWVPSAECSLPRGSSETRGLAAPGCQSLLHWLWQQ